MRRAKIKNKYRDYLFYDKDMDKPIERTDMPDENKNNLTDKIKPFFNVSQFFIFIGFLGIMLFGATIFLSVLILLGLNCNHILFSFLGNALVLGFFLYFYRKDIVQNFREFFSKNFFKMAGMTLKYWAIGFFVMWLCNIILAIVSDGGIASNEEAVRTLIQKAPLYMAFQLSIYAPITEEIIFRKSTRNIFRDDKIYVLFSGLVFGLMHVISVQSFIEFLYIIPYGALGVAFACLYKKSNNIFSSIFVHSFHNSLALVMYLISGVI